MNDSDKKSDVADEEGIDLPPADSIDSGGVPSPEEIMNSVEKLIDAAEDKLALDLAHAYASPGEEDSDLVLDDYKEIVAETKNGSGDHFEHADNVVGKGKYFDYIRPEFKSQTTGSRTELEKTSGELRKVWETLDKLRSSGEIKMLSTDFAEWSGKTVSVLRYGFAEPFSQAMYNQQAAIKVLYSNVLTYIELQNERRSKAKAIADAATAVMKKLTHTDDDGMDAAASFSMLSALLTIAAGLASGPATGGTSTILAFTVAAGAAAFAGCTTGTEKSGLEGAEDFMPSGGESVFDTMRKVSSRLVDLDNHVMQAENALQEVTEAAIADIEDVLKAKGYHDFARSFLPMRVDPKTIDTEGLKPPGW